MKKYICEKATLGCLPVDGVEQYSFIPTSVAALPEVLPSEYCYLDEESFGMIVKVKNHQAEFARWDGDLPVIVEKTEAQLVSERMFFENSGKLHSLKVEANGVIQPLLGYAVAGILDDDDKDKFERWNRYRKSLDGIDVYDASPAWPAKPE